MIIHLRRALAIRVRNEKSRSTNYFIPVRTMRNRGDPGEYAPAEEPSKLQGL
jgi:hypothetical protein